MNTRFRARLPSNLVIEVALATALLSATTEVGAVVSAECATSFESAQVLRKKGAYWAARDQLVICDRSCSAEIQRQCSRWFAEIDRLVPSIIVDAKAGGEDRSDVGTEMDGKLLTETADGKAVSIDPGQHHFTFNLRGYRPEKKIVVLHDGEQLRIVRVEFQSPLAAVASSPHVDVAGWSPDVRRPVPALVYVLGGVAAIGAASFVLLGSSANAKRNRLEETCSPRCPPDEVSALHSQLVWADISLGAALAALTAGAVVWLTRPSLVTEPDRTSFTIVPTQNGATASATVRF
jgi:hypothetical protein